MQSTLLLGMGGEGGERFALDQFPGREMVVVGGFVHASEDCEPVIHTFNALHYARGV